MTSPLRAFPAVATELFMQQGPSCWLFVVEAVAHARGKGTRYLRAVMNSYPSSDAVEEAMNAHPAPKPNRRTLALRLTEQNLDALVRKLLLWDAGPGGDHDRGLIDRTVVARYARDALGSTGSVDVLLPEPGRYEVPYVVAEYHQAHQRAVKLVQLAAQDTNEVAALLNTGWSEIGGGQAADDAHVALCEQSVPAYAGVRRRFKLRSTDRDDVLDCTGRPVAEMEPTVHAVLLQSYDPKTRVVSYKDPNYGNIEIRVSLTQFLAMAGDESVRLRPFFSDGVQKSRLADVLD
ncbi:hypothetical protein [Polymorphospora sp. A560]|uniref:hypothetical protein n=1 Tax=Polymorphospora sp. A560 TaxID=3040203 RepID=UPI003892857A